MYAPDDPFAVRRPAPPVAGSEAEPAIDVDVAPQAEPAVEPETPTESGTPVEAESLEAESFEPDLELLDRAEATYAGAAQVIELVDAGDLDQAEALLDSLVGQPSE